MIEGNTLHTEFADHVVITNLVPRAVVIRIAVGDTAIDGHTATTGIALETFKTGIVSRITTATVGRQFRGVQPHDIIVSSDLRFDGGPMFYI